MSCGKLRVYFVNFSLRVNLCKSYDTFEVLDTARERDEGYVVHEIKKSGCPTVTALFR